MPQAERPQGVGPTTQDGSPGLNSTLDQERPPLRGSNPHPSIWSPIVLSPGWGVRPWPRAKGLGSPALAHEFDVNQDNVTQVRISLGSPHRPP
jgi:hypothetical protein